MTTDRKIKTVGGFITVTPEGHVNAFVAKSKSWCHFSRFGSDTLKPNQGYTDPITAGLTWVQMMKNCKR